MTIKEKRLSWSLPRYIAILVHKLDMKKQPNKGSSIYKIPSRKKIIPGQEKWMSPVGTLRLSNHWNYRNWLYETVYQTDIRVPERVWVLAINVGGNWKVLEIIKKDVCAIKSINFQKIEEEVDMALTH